MIKTPTTNIREYEANRRLFTLVCVYCRGKVGSLAISVDGDAAHKACHREACK